MTSTIRPLASDLGERIDALRSEVEGSGHDDIEHLLELAAQLARLRCVAQMVTLPLDPLALPIVHDRPRPALSDLPEIGTARSSPR